jgi:1,4-dihydroxy-2-naphthoate octaprenyltransferase
VKGDRAAGRRTLAVLLGASRSRWLIYAEGLGAYVVAALLILRNTLPPTVWFAVGAGVPLSILSYLQMHRRGYTHATKGPSMQGVIRAFVGFTLLLTGALIAEAVLLA